jgi:O-antigen/teichoic acid export membrane protein
MSRILKNSLFNLMGQVLPLLVALAAVPVCVSGLGMERFGILSIAWTMLAYFAFFDMGLGRGTTKYFAEALKSGSMEKLGSIIWVSMSLNVVLGVAGLASLVLFAPVLAADILKTPEAMLPEAVRAFTILAFSIPMVTMMAVLRGVIEAAERFDMSNLLKVLSNSLIFLIPIVCVLMGTSLETLFFWMVMSRLVSMLAFFWAVIRLFPDHIGNFRFKRSLASQLLRYGGWVTLSNMLNPIISYGERVLIPAMLSLTMLSYYSAPYELISRMAVVPASLSLTLFPRFSGVENNKDGSALSDLILRPSKYLLLVLTPVTMVFVAFAREILFVWLGADFASVSGSLLMILAVAFFVNALAYVPLAAVQGMGRPDMKAKLDFAAAPLFAVLCWLGIMVMGIDGAAWAKLVVSMLDTVCLFIFAALILGLPAYKTFSCGMTPAVVSSVVSIASVFAATSLGAALSVRTLVFIVMLVAFGIVFWKKAVDDSDKAMMNAFLVRFHRSGRV